MKFVVKGKIKEMYEKYTRVMDIKIAFRTG
jgi:hypothetical protein